MAEQLTQVGYVGYSGTGYTYCSEIIINSQNIQQNKSNITVNFKVMPTGNSAGYSQYKNLSATMGITSDNGLTQSVDITGYKTANTRNQYSTIGTWTGDVNHNNDGTLYITVAVKYGFTSGDAWLPKQTTTNFVYGLTTIPRASDIALSTSSLTISGTSGSITWTATSKADYYHTLTWSLGGSNTVITALNHLNNTTQTGTLSYTTLLSKLPSNATGTLTLTLSTYSDSGRTSLVGTKTASCSITITIVPSITTFPNPSVLSSPITNYAIAGYSTMQVANIATSKPSGASNVTTYVSTNYVQMATGSFTGTSGTVTTQTLPAKEDGNDTFNITFTAYAQDTRGNRSANISKIATVYKYIKPTPNLTAYRVASSGSTTQDGSGTYLYIHATATLNSSINGQNSIQTKVVKVNNTTTTVDANGDAWVSLPTTSSATVTYDVSDKVTSTSAVPVQVSVAKFPVYMYDNGAGSVGVGLGGVAKNGLVSAYLPIQTSYRDAVAMGSFQATSNTVPDLVNELRYSSGVMGSASITTEYTSGAVTIPTGWYNFIYSPHRSGGISGSASGDNCNYGSLILIGMTGFFGMYRIRISSASIAEVNRVCETPIQFFTSVSNVGETVGSPTVNTVFNAMPNKSLLVCDVTDFASSQRPTGYGTVQIYRQNSSKGWVVCYGKEAVDYRMYMGTSGGPNGIWIRTNNNSYSTSETNTGGTWVDGKTIYKKTLSFNNTAIGNGTTLAHNISSISEIVKAEGHLNANGTYIGFPSTTNNSSNDLSFRVDTTQIQWFGNDSWGAQTSRTIYITIWYTKTS